MSDYAPLLPTRIPGLDGLRAISIAAVVIGHVAGTRGFLVSVNGAEHLGNFGVKVFFVISGFLITTLLLKERDASGGISLKNFYVRRVIRIFPAFYAYIAAMVIANHFGAIDLPDGDLLHAVTYTMNYHHDRGWHLNHLWSLSVEEQFYLLWPAVLVFSGPRKGIVVAAIVVVLAPLIRLGMWYLGAPASAFTREFQAVSDVLAIGCVLAGAHNWLGRRRAYMALLRWTFFPTIPALLLALSFASYKSNPTLFYVIGQSLASVGIALFIDYTVRFPGGKMGHILNSGPFVYVGALSYSLYLWQEPFLDPTSTSWVSSFPQNLAFTAIASLLSYHLIEKAFMRFRRHFTT